MTLNFKHRIQFTKRLLQRDVQRCPVSSKMLISFQIFAMQVDIFRELKLLFQSPLTTILFYEIIIVIGYQAYHITCAYIHTQDKIKIIRIALALVLKIRKKNSKEVCHLINPLLLQLQQLQSINHMCLSKHLNHFDRQSDKQKNIKRKPL